MLKEEIIRSTESVEPKRYKYILNGETFYFTREELRKREVEINAKNNIFFPDDIVENNIDRLIERLEEYNGDRFGHYAGCPELHQRFHKAEAKGIRIVFS
jgi:hypothetical protein